MCVNKREREREREREILLNFVLLYHFYCDIEKIWNVKSAISGTDVIFFFISFKLLFSFVCNLCCVST